MTALLVATQNMGKLNEYRQMLSELQAVEWLSLTDVGLETMDVEETGTTFAENAQLKAYHYQQASGLITLADDSGLVVDALDGAPGVYSARYGAPIVSSDVGRYELLLENLKDTPINKRTARFMCVIAIALPNQAMNDIQTVQGSVEGRIAFAPRGTNGFGYDPIFELPDGRMIAELPPYEKNAISHRGNALMKALPVLKEYLS